MGLEIILNGGFDFDPSAEKVRESFEKAKNMFAEIYGKYVFDSLVAGQILAVKPDGTGFELIAAPGGGDLLSSNNLSDVDNASTARTNLGLGSAAESEAIDFASAAQGTKADSAIQSITNAGGVTIDVTNPQNPTIAVDAVTVTGLSFNPATGILTLAVDGGSDLTVDLSAYTVLKVGGLIVDKDGANTDYNTIENNDKAHGWEGDKFIAFKQVSGSRKYAVNGGIF